MIALQYEIQTRTLHNLIDKLAKSYDDQQKTWAKSSSELNEVARILKNGGWSCGNVEQLITAIQLRLIYNKPQTKQSYSIAKDAALQIIDRVQSDFIQTKQNGIDLKDYL